MSSSRPTVRGRGLKSACSIHRELNLPVTAAWTAPSREISSLRTDSAWAPPATFTSPRASSGRQRGIRRRDLRHALPEIQTGIVRKPRASWTAAGSDLPRRSEAKAGAPRRFRTCRQFPISAITWCARKRRRRCALPAQMTCGDFQAPVIISKLLLKL